MEEYIWVSLFISGFSLAYAMVNSYKYSQLKKRIENECVSETEFRRILRSLGIKYLSMVDSSFIMSNGTIANYIRSQIGELALKFGYFYQTESTQAGWMKLKKEK